MYTVEVEYKLNDQWIRETIQDVVADDEVDARDIAYSHVRRNNPNAEFVDVLSVTDETEGV